MVDATAIQGSITQLINNLGSTLSVRNLTSTTKDKWGTKIRTYGSPTNIVAVPDELLTFEKREMPQGILNRASMILIAKGTATINIDDLVVHSGKNYIVISVQPFLISDIALAIQFALEENNDNIA